MIKISNKFKQDEIQSDADYWADKTMDECFEATCFMVEQYISWNNLPSRMDKTVFEKTNKHKEWAEEQKIWDSFSDREREMFYK